MALENSVGPAEIEEEENTKDFRRIFSIFWRRKWIIINIALVAAIFSSIYAFKLPDTYTTNSVILIERLPSAILKQQTADVSFRAAVDARYRAHAHLFKSFPVLKEVVGELNLQEKFAYFPQEEGKMGMPLTLEEAILQLEKMIAVTYVDQVYTVEVTYLDPKMAAAICNTLTEVYMKQNLEGMLYVSKEIKALYPQAIKTFQKMTPTERLENLSQLDLIAKLPTVQGDRAVLKLEQELYEIKNETNQLTLRYKEKHPKMIESRRSDRFAQKRLDVRMFEIAEGLREKVVNRFKEANIRVLSEAEVPGRPTGPNRLKIILIAVLGALGAAMGFIRLLDKWDDRINNDDDVEKYLGIPFLGSILKIRNLKDEIVRGVYVAHHPLSEAAEMFKQMRVSINFSLPSGKGKSIVVTSTNPQEGKSFIAANLAISNALDEKKVIVVDADIRRPKIHTVFQKQNTNGLSNYLTTDIDLDEVIQKTDVENLDIISSGPSSPNPPEILGSDRMKGLIQALEKRYSFIVYDTPPSCLISDTLVLGNIIPATIYVVQAHKYPRKTIAKSIKHLLAKGVKITGVALNNLDVVKAGGYYYDYKGNKGYGYSYSGVEGVSKK